MRAYSVLQLHFGAWILYKWERERSAFIQPVTVRRNCKVLKLGRQGGFFQGILTIDKNMKFRRNLKSDLKVTARIIFWGDEIGVYQV